MYEFNCVILVKQALDILSEKPECISCDYHCVSAVYQCYTQYYNVFSEVWVGFLFSAAQKRLEELGSEIGDAEQQVLKVTGELQQLEDVLAQKKVSLKQC